MTSNKAIATPRGTFELKYFFTTAISGTRGGEAHSAEAVRYRKSLLHSSQQVDGLAMQLVFLHLPGHALPWCTSWPRAPTNRDQASHLPLWIASQCSSM
ncbi:MAG: hypothetical protein ACKPKO_35310 [Candidatus Fonsibacter sp.]